MSSHALLSASSAHRWMNCPPSARLGEQYPDVSSEFAAEGTDAHSLCEYKVKHALGQEAKDPTEDLTHYNAEMEDCAAGYAAYVTELASKSASPLVLTEQRLDFSEYVPEGFGTADCIIVTDRRLDIVDYKYGKGVQVESDGNPQLRLYALGALLIFGGLYDIDTVGMTIYQPRLSNISSCEITPGDLLGWAEEKLKPAAKLAYSGEGDCKCGDWCRFCKVRADCRARAACNLSLAGYDFRKPPQLTNDEVAEILGRAGELEAWVGDIRDYALRAALSGEKFTGWKLAEGRANRRYTDETAVASVVTDAGFDPYEHGILSITEMQKLLGKSRFEELLGPYVSKPQGKPTLVPDSDKRPEYDTSDFKEETCQPK